MSLFEGKEEIFLRLLLTAIAALSTHDGKRDTCEEVCKLVPRIRNAQNTEGSLLECLESTLLCVHLKRSYSHSVAALACLIFVPELSVEGDVMSFQNNSESFIFVWYIICVSCTSLHRPIKSLPNLKVGHLR